MRASVRAAATGAFVVALVAGSAVARAQSSEIDPEPRAVSERRAVPDYDGLASPGPSAEEVLLWFPRLLFSPLYIATEYLIRRPFGWLTTELERANIPVFFYDLFTWDEHKAGLVPTAFYEFGLLPSVGLYFFWNDAGTPGHRIRAHAAFGGIDYLRGSLSNRVVLREGVELGFSIEAEQRPDQIYQGVGARSQVSDRARYRHGLVDGTVELRLRPWRNSMLRVSAGVTNHEFDPDGYDPGGVEPSLTDAVAFGQLRALPPGMVGYTAYRQRLFAALDTREEPPAPRHGVRVEAYAEQGFDLRAPTERSWIHYGGALSGYVDLGSERVVSLHVWTELADSLGAAEVPFTELASLGGSLLELPGFYRGQLIGRSAVVATLQYRYPIWSRADAALFVAAGNVFGERFEDLALDALRLSWGLALDIAGEEDHGFLVALAFGTATLDQDAGVESVRFLIGGAPSF